MFIASSSTFWRKKSSCFALTSLVWAITWFPSHLAAQKPDAPSKRDTTVAVQQGHLEQVSTVALSGNGQVLVTTSFDGTIRVWDARMGSLVRVLRSEARSSGPPPVVLSPDGKLLGARIVSGEVGIWDIDTGRQLGACKYPYGRSLEFSQDSSVLVVAGGTKVFLCNWKQPGSDKELDMDRTLYSFALSHDGTKIVTTSEDAEIQVWNAKTGDELTPLQGHTDSVLSAAFSPTENLVATGSKDKSARIWNLDTGTVRVITTEANFIIEVRFSPDGSQLLTKNSEGLVEVWDAKAGKSIGALASSIFSGVASFSPDGGFVSVPNRHSVMVLNLRTGRKFELKLTDLASLTIAYDPGGLLLAVGDGSDPTIWDLNTSSLKSRFGRHTRSLHALGLSVDGAELAAADPLALTLWNMETGETRSLFPDSNIPERASMVFSPDRKVLAISADTSLSERTTALWATDDGRKLLSISDSAGAPIVFSSSGRYFAHLDPSGIVRILDLSGDLVPAKRIP
jgi:WD40 repeat protein